MAQDSALEPGKNYGIPPRTLTSASLWAHLLRKDTARGQSPNLGPALPPITPLDKNGTSMRILLHDTQAHLDRFAEKSDKLFNKIEETKQEISIVNTLFRREHDTLTEELVDLVNRSQTQIQNSIGIPAQTEQLGRLSKDVTAHLEALDKRLDAIHSFNQTHSQMLQLQSQAIQSLQEQHGTMLTAIIPLLPLLQSIPLHIESARNKITDVLNKPAAPPITQSEPDPSCDGPSPDGQRRRSKRSSATFGPGNVFSTSNRKKARINNITPCTGENELPIPVPAVVNHAHRGEFGSSLRGSVPSASSSPSRLLRQETTTVHSPRSVPMLYHQIPFSKQVDHTAPLSSPPTHPGFVPSSKRQPLIPCTNSMSLINAELLQNGSQITQAIDTSHPPPMSTSSGFATPSSGSTRPSALASRALTRRLWLTTHKSRGEIQRQSFKPSSTLSSSPDLAPARNVNINDLAVPHEKNRLFLIGPGCHPTPSSPGLDTNISRPSAPTALHGVSTGQTSNTPVLRPQVQASLFAPPPHQTRKPLLAHITASSPMLTPQQVKIRERRSPRKEGRRFIPLDDSDEEDMELGG
ncbi:hypothetical protein C0992_011892 [Termitomyces sp. T32_za158]|nr:hypothetical protein C0992_011892 [Termitomyces sp. T32_za158]